ncbi:DNA helicase II [Candidatus Palibaumannia cicadellinicola]|uniref:DNA 3'-5' helicase n=1 Tax=Candidatus Palibaumannia cicadellinicola TaxID=186490 RepID=A0A0K2BKK9_9GAMM|nr:DNA helicase II [Candidatus Baumannia cicadellinicola]AKZ65724.1 ATP-dependent DNA helicase UvrD/PcrA [Candidatus Baumannia cicadellinicola]
MHISGLLNSLNNQQRKAVSAPIGNIMVIAGAGSGKTRVIAHRIAWLISVKNCLPSSILAVTFTNKSAEEMRSRIENIIGDHSSGMWIGTFHSLAYRILRINYINAHLPKNFQVIDSEDQLKLVKNIIRYLNLDETTWQPCQAMWYINKNKDEGRRPNNINNYYNKFEETWFSIYKIYQEICNNTGLVDFAELILRVYEMLINNSNIMQYYRNKFTTILVDEFQDTNNIQYYWIRMLAGNKGNVTIVGDDDQSIYRWRGAQVENIQRFINDFPKVKIICLEQNYRSTSNILYAANQLIANNIGSRITKNLWTNNAVGEQITIYCALNELDEAKFVINCIKINKKNGGLLQECAILYRNNAQSRVIEESLINMKIPYHIYGGMRFFERQEVKNVLAYLQLISNKNNDAAYERIINIPIRGIGLRTIEKLRNIACNRQLTLWQASLVLINERMISNKLSLAMQNFITLINELERDTANLPLHMQTQLVIQKSGLLAMYQKEIGDKDQARIKNIEELITAAKQFYYEDKDMLPLQAFLSHVALEETIDKQMFPKDAVQLMTIHSAKGLEFKQVFIVGMEEGIFPSQQALNEQKNIEEERRLAYVGVTRAMKKLTITYAKKRYLYGQEAYRRRSRFISELPKQCLEQLNYK